MRKVLKLALSFMVLTSTGTMAFPHFGNNLPSIRGNVEGKVEGRADNLVPLPQVKRKESKTNLGKGSEELPVGEGYQWLVKTGEGLAGYKTFLNSHSELPKVKSNNWNMPKFPKYTGSFMNDLSKTGGQVRVAKNKGSNSNVCGFYAASRNAWTPTIQLVPCKGDKRVGRNYFCPIGKTMVAIGQADTWYHDGENHYVVFTCVDTPDGVKDPTPDGRRLIINYHGWKIAYGPRSYWLGTSPSYATTSDLSKVNKTINNLTADLSKLEQKVNRNSTNIAYNKAEIDKLWKALEDSGKVVSGSVVGVIYATESGVTYKEIVNTGDNPVIIKYQCVHCSTPSTPTGYKPVAFFHKYSGIMLNLGYASDGWHIYVKEGYYYDSFTQLVIKK